MKCKDKTKHNDSTTPTTPSTTYYSDNCVMVESLTEPIIKMVSVLDLFIINYGSFSDRSYDPNVDDPMNKYSHDEKNRLISEAVLNTPFV